MQENVDVHKLLFVT